MLSLTIVNYSHAELNYFRKKLKIFTLLSELDFARYELHQRLLGALSVLFLTMGPLFETSLFVFARACVCVLCNIFKYYV